MLLESGSFGGVNGLWPVGGGSLSSARSGITPALSPLPSKPARQCCSGSFTADGQRSARCPWGSISTSLSSSSGLLAVLM